MPLQEQRRLAVVAVTIFTMLAAVLATPAANAARGAQCYTAWDDYYFYAAFQVNDPHVNSVNHTPFSQPQQDDDVEVFFDTNGYRASKARTTGTYQMAVSAGKGAYFSVGDPSGKAKAKLVFTYKFATTIDGTLNKNDDTDTGYTIELAIPWQELGLTGPPADGTAWGFNVINRDRDSATEPADHLTSLSPLVKGADDVQNPQDWTKITFTTTTAPQSSGAENVFSPHVVDHFPIIDGVVRSGEYETADGFSLGAPTVAAAAPTTAEEPNINLSASDMYQAAIASTPAPEITPHTGKKGQAQPAAPPAAPVPGPAPVPVPVPTPAPGTQEATVPDYNLELPGGGTIHIGKMQAPPPAPPEEAPEVPAPEPRKGHGHHNPWPFGGSGSSSGTGAYGPQYPTVGPSIDTSQGIPLAPQTRVSPLLLALYRDDFPSTASFIDQPINAEGAWFGGGSVQYQVDQLKDARRAGVDALLVRYDPHDPTADSALLTLVQAEQELRAANLDYPLLALWLDATPSDTYAAVRGFFERVPPEFRAQALLPDDQGNQFACIAVLKDASGGANIAKQFAADFPEDGGGLLVAQMGAKGLTVVSPAGVSIASAVVTPVSDPTKPVSDRLDGQAYDDSWTAALATTPDWVVVDSWNDYARGVEVAATRQYGEHYADNTKLNSLSFNGGQEWHARYLKCDVPAVMSPDAVTTVQVRLVNAGTLPWRLGEAYGLGYRWYRDGRLYDDSAPVLPVTIDIYPGNSATLNVGILPRNQYGKPLEPGDYTLVFDMVQGDDRWFSLAGDVGAKVHVRIASADDPVSPRAHFIDSTLPTRIEAGATYSANVTLRNDSPTAWVAGETSLGFVATPDDGGSPITGGAAVAAGVAPGAPVTVTVPVKLDGSAGESFQIKWTVQNPDSAGHLYQHVRLASADDGAVFVLSDVPRNLTTNGTFSGQLGIVNEGTQAWTGGKWKVGYHWTYLDGLPIQGYSGPLATITGNIPPGTATAVTAKFETPAFPGRYFLVCDVRDPNGEWSSEQGAKMHGDASLPLLVSVTPGRDARAEAVNLAKFTNIPAEAFDGETTSDFDGSGNAVPAIQMPPDGTADLNSNPVLTGTLAPAGYPSGFYAGADAGDHNISFQMPLSKDGKTAVECRGQVIGIPGGYSAIHILAAASGDSPVSAQFGIAGSTVTVGIAPWSQAPTAPGSTVGLRFEYRMAAGHADASEPCILGDYEIALPPGARSITLPNNPAVKVFAMTVSK